MNLPNRLTILRVLLIPVFVAFAFIPGILWDILALLVFWIASFTDFLDGNIARKRGIVTNFGKFMDPLADKLLVTAALSVLAMENNSYIWVLFIITLREYIVAGVRMVAAEGGKVIAASMWGKVKTVVQMVVISIGLFPFNIGQHLAIGGVSVLDVLMWATAVLTVISGWDYLGKNLKLFKDI
ncbi:MAG: CDP-diacylglycerol--glycerol-3-phosphate 3-phosphatidyltransferase [Clostridia bacterium]|nr:CDP-diacylglycerol--glycerol-3-phosphate 3-phosphatidyltransferase [Clostridia bacterium]